MTPMTTTKKTSSPVPNGETIWVRGFDSDGVERYIITSNKLRDHYFLYALENGEWRKVAKARSPSAFEGRVKLYFGG